MSHCNVTLTVFQAVQTVILSGIDRLIRKWSFETKHYTQMRKLLSEFLVNDLSTRSPSLPPSSLFLSLLLASSLCLFLFPPFPPATPPVKLEGVSDEAFAKQMEDFRHDWKSIRKSRRKLFKVIFGCC